ncbi:hypothetical protein Tco_1509860 [Tanacetum coccineum]
MFSKTSKEKETKNIDKEIVLEKKVKELDNIVYKIGQSAQTVHMLTKPQVFYGNNLKQALGFQNPFYLKKAQHIRPMLYDGSVIVKETNVILIADSEETLMLEEVSRSKMLLKQSDQIVLEKKVNIKPINYAELNRLSKDFGKCFVPQQELSDEQAFWLQTSHPNTNQSASSPVKIEAPRELPKTNSALKFKRNNFLIENDQLLDQIISQDIVNIIVNYYVNMNTSVNVNSYVAMNDSVNYVEKCNKCLELEAELIKQHNMVEKDEYNRLSKSFSKLEQHCISLELAMQLNKEIFQNNSTSINQIEPTFDHVFELNILKAELQAKDTTIENLKANIKRLNKHSTTNSVKKDIDEIETINIELEHSVAKLLSENKRLHIELEHFKKIYKDQFDSIKKTRVLSKEHGDSLIAQLNSKSMENADLKHLLQDKVFVITSLKNDLRKLKGKETIEKAAHIPIATTVAPVMFKLDLDPLAPRLLQNREAHIYYLKHTQEQADILRED